MRAGAALMQLAFAAGAGAAIAAEALPAPAGEVEIGWWCVPGGAAAGLLLFAALARQPPGAWALRAGRRRVFAFAAGSLVIRSAYEEAVWRALVLGVLLTLAEPAAAIALSLVPWSLAHRRRHGRAAVAQIATGAAFGGLYWGSGSLLAPIAAHASYNVAVCLGVVQARTTTAPA